MDIKEQRDLPFPERIKAESEGTNVLSKEFVEKERRKDLGAEVRIVKKLGRPITDREVESLNI